MSRVMLSVVLALASGVVAADDALSARTPAEVVNHHIAAMLKGDAAALIEDYADDAVLVFTTRVVSGKEEVRKFFSAASGRRTAADEEAVFKIASVSGDVVIEEYTHKTPDGATVTGADVIVVRKGKIIFQTTQKTSTQQN